MRGSNTTNGRSKQSRLIKCPSGIKGLDEVADGGLPAGRPILVCGGPGCGKTLFALEFLIRGAMEYGEPGVFMSFEETADDLDKNTRSLGFDLPELIRKKKIVLDHVRVERNEIEETGEYDLEGLFIRLNHAIDSIGAKRVVLDTIESLFAGLSNQSILRAELRRLFKWLKEKGVTTVITGERGDGQLTRQGLEEYVSDCVILLDHRVIDQVSTRRLRIVKYRGSTHGTNEYPFLIDRDGISVMPITAMGLNHPASSARVSSGVPRLDAMLGGKGFFKGSTILLAGTAGTGKTSLSAHIAHAACQRGQKVLYFAFEESPAQMIRNMRSIGLEMEKFVRSGKLHFRAIRPYLYGLESHLAAMHKLILEQRPDLVVIDPITNFVSIGSEMEVKAMLTRLIDFLKSHQITGVLVNLTSNTSLEATDMGISSLVDTWILLRDIEINGERNRGLYVLKSRGMAHSNQIREFLLTSHGIELQDVYLGPSGVLTGTARAAQEAREKAEELLRLQTLDAQNRERMGKSAAIEAQIIALQAELESYRHQDRQLSGQEQARQSRIKSDRQMMARFRKADRAAVSPGALNNGKEVS